MSGCCCCCLSIPSLRGMGLGADLVPHARWWLLTWQGPTSTTSWAGAGAAAAPRCRWPGATAWLRSPQAGATRAACTQTALHTAGVSAGVAAARVPWAALAPPTHDGCPLGLLPTAVAVCPKPVCAVQCLPACPPRTCFGIRGAFCHTPIAMSAPHSRAAHNPPAAAMPTCFAAPPGASALACRLERLRPAGHRQHSSIPSARPRGGRLPLPPAVSRLRPHLWGAGQRHALVLG